MLLLPIAIFSIAEQGEGWRNDRTQIPVVNHHGVTNIGAEEACIEMISDVTGRRNDVKWQNPDCR
jgi:hypothetical protein